MEKQLTALDILNKWAKYADFDPERKQFNLLSNTYEYHRAGEQVMKLGQLGYDPNGIISALYVKQTFMKVMQNAKVDLFALLQDPSILDAEREMYDTFTSETMQAIEREFLAAIDTMVMRMSGRKMLGGAVAENEEDQTMRIIMGSVDSVTKELSGCNVDVFQHGGPFQPITKLNTTIQIFPRLADCLMTMSGAPDAAYLCYIDQEGLEGYFGFFLKSNGNMVFINERINESYSGEHTRHRNHRWAEDKKTSLFPYKAVIQFSGSDYKGCATNQVIDDERLDFFKLGAENFVPIVLAVFMLSSRFTSEDLSAMPRMFVDSLMSVNVQKLEGTEKALAIPTGNEIAVAHQVFTPTFTLESVLDGTASDQFDIDAAHQNAKEGERPSLYNYGYFSNDNQFMVDLWGEGFQYQPDTLLETRMLPVTGNLVSQKIEYVQPPEFVGSEHKMSMEAYRRVRQQLADYMRGRIYDAYVEFGGMRAIHKWYKEQLQTNLQKITFMAAHYLLLDKDDERMPDVLKRNIDAFRYTENTNPSFGPFSSWAPNVLNTPILGGKYNSPTGKYKCFVTGNTCSYFVEVRPADWLMLEDLLGIEMPRILKGWKPEHDTRGNSILWATDPVDRVGTPIEENERTRYGQNYYYLRGSQAVLAFPEHGEEQWSKMALSFCIGFSRRGLDTIAKQHGLPKRKKNEGGGGDDNHSVRIRIC